MATWSLVGVSNGSTSASGNYTLTEPAGCQANDILVVDFVIRSTIQFSNAAWTFPQTEGGGNTTNNTTASDCSFQTGYCIRGASAPSLVFTRSGGSRATGSIRAYRSSNAGAPTFHTSAKVAQTGATTTLSLSGGVTTTEADQLLVTGVFLARASATTAQASAMDAATGATGNSGALNTASAPAVDTWTERVDRGDINSPTLALACYDAVKSTAGATGALTCTAANSALHGMTVMAFKHPVATIADAWSAADKSATITLSNSDKTASTSSTALAGVRSTTSIAGTGSGKFYAEFVTGSTKPESYGLNLASASITSFGDSAAYNFSNGLIFIDGASSGINIGTGSASDIVSIAWDANASKVWFRRNGGNWNASGTADPATGVDGLTTTFSSSPYCLWATVNFNSGASFTLRTEYSDGFTYAAPSGFSSWMGELPSTADAWNVNDKSSATLTLSNSDKTATLSSGSTAGVRSTTKHTNFGGVKYYAEFVVGSTPALYYGIKRDVDGLTSGVGFYLYGATGDIVVDGAFDGSIGGAIAAGDVIRMAWDTSAQYGWFSKNGGIWNNNALANPATGDWGLDLGAMNGGSYALWGLFQTVGSSVTLRTEASEFGFALPSGFLSWMGELPPTADAWDVNDKTSVVVLSDADKTAQIESVVTAHARSTETHTGATAGKYYAEFEVTANPNGIGIIPKTADINYGNSEGVLFSYGSIYVGGGAVDTVSGSLGSGGVLSIAWDAGAGICWMRIDGGSWNGVGGNPATGAGGVYVGAFTSQEYALWAAFSTTSAYLPIMLRTELADFDYAVPTGFVSWMGETPGGGGPTHYTMPAATGAVTLAGIAVTLTKGNVAFREQSTSTFASRTNTTVNVPVSVVNGDILIAAHIVKSGGSAVTVTPPAGFTKIDSTIVFDALGYAADFAVYWKRAAGESGSYTFTHAAAESQLVVAAYANCIATGSPIDTFAKNWTTNPTTFGATASVFSLTTTVPNTKLVYAQHNWVGTGALTPPTGGTERFDSLVYLSDEQWVATGATGTRAQNTGNAANQPWGVIFIALKPATVSGVTHYTMPAAVGARALTGVDVTLTYTPAGGAPWTPAQIPIGHIGWYDGADASKLVFSGSNLTQWTDKSPAANNMTPHATGPTLASVNGLGSLSFNIQGLKSTSAVSLGNFTMFAVFTPDASGNYERILDHDVSNGFWWGRDGTTATWGGGIRLAVSPYGYFVPLANGSCHQIMMQRSGTTENISGNGGAVTNSVACSGTATASNVIGVASAYNDATPTDRMNGDIISEILIWSNVLSAGDQSKVEGYLAWKWGIQASLPVGHPYKSAPPMVAGAAYTLTAAAGAVALAGPATGLRVGRKMPATAGAVTLAGPATGLRLGRKLPAAVRAFTFAGPATPLFIFRKLYTAVRSFVFAGPATGLRAARFTRADVTPYILTRNDATLSRTTVLTHYTMPAAVGALTLNGQNVALKRIYKVPHTAGAFTLTGVATALRFAHKMPAVTGAFTLNGVVTGLRFGHRLIAATGALTFAGPATTLRFGHRLGVTPGAFTLTGIGAGLNYVAVRKLVAATGTVTLGSNPATLRYTRVFPISAGAFTLNGQPATLRYSHKLIAAVGAFTLNGQSAALRVSRVLIAAKGTFTLNGQPATLSYKRIMTATSGAITLNGVITNLIYSGTPSKVLPVTSASFVLNGQPATLRRIATLPITKGTFTLAGTAAALRVTRRIVAATGARTLNGQPAALRATRRMAAVAGSYNLTGYATGLRLDRRISAAPRAYTLTGYSVNLVKSYAGQGLFPDRYDDPDTFFGFAVSAGVIQLHPDRYDDPDTFYAPEVTSRVTLAAGFYSDPDVFYPAIITNYQILAPTLFLDPDRFFTHVISWDQILAPQLFVDPDFFPHATISVLYEDTEIIRVPYEDRRMSAEHEPHAMVVAAEVRWMEAPGEYPEVDHPMVVAAEDRRMEVLYSDRAMDSQSRRRA